MRQQWLSILGLLIVTSALLAACAGNGATPATTSPLPTALAPQGAPVSNVTNSQSSIPYAAQTVDGGNVTVQVTPLTIKMGTAPEFDIAMNTHSVDLAADMIKTVVLRDDSGTEYAPTTWDGPSGGGHHREGKIKFPPLTRNTKSLTLVVKNIAGMPERLYKWDLTQ